MNWFHKKLHKRKNIIANLREQIFLSTLPDISLLELNLLQNEESTFYFAIDSSCQSEDVDVKAKLFQHNDNTFNISVEEYTQKIDVYSPGYHKDHIQFNVNDIYRIFLFFDLKPTQEKILFKDIIKVHILSLSNYDFTIQIIPLNDFIIEIHRFDFEPERQEPRTLFPRGKSSRGVTGIRITPIETPSRPTTLDKRNLEERLKWILTPPIHEILSDPQLSLPEKPYSFQTYGIKWLYDRENVLLADEMGLGKTMQAIIAARLLWRENIIKQVLVVCPKTLISNWKNEFSKWWPQVTQYIHIAGTDRQFFLKLGTPNVIVKIINYESLSRELEWLKDQKFDHDLIIIDEAQRIKSPAAKASQAVKILKAKRRWALTGTPLENKIDDLISIFGFIEPKMISDNDSDATIRNRIRPYILRRRTDEVDIELPEKDEQDIAIDLEPEQYKTYKKMEDDGVVELNEKGESITVTHVFALITKLREICNFCPVTGKSAKLEQLLDDMDEIKESGRKALVFSQYVTDECGLLRISKELDSKGHKNLLLYGKTSHKIDDIVKQFSTDKTVSSLLLQFKVGGVGVNIQAANYVFLFDRWWNPAVEDQLPKRAHRIGQTQKVFVRKFYCKDTIEERILKILAKKRELFRQMIDENRLAESMGLTEEEIFSLFNLKVRPRKLTHHKEQESVNLILDNMTPSQFEILASKIYEKQGYEVSVTGGSHDEGIDVIAEKFTGNTRDRVVIQCKHQKATVGRPELQKLWGVIMNDHSITRGDFVTSSNFSSEAINFASGKRLYPIDRSELLRLAREFKVAFLE
jgi:SNF2 family DNA or RNA helicase